MKLVMSYVIVAFAICLFGSIYANAQEPSGNPQFLAEVMLSETTARCSAKSTATKHTSTQKAAFAKCMLTKRIEIMEENNRFRGRIDYLTGGDIADLNPELNAARVVDGALINVYKAAIASADPSAQQAYSERNEILQDFANWWDLLFEVERMEERLQALQN